MAIRNHLENAIGTLERSVQVSLEDLQWAAVHNDRDWADRRFVAHSLAVATLAHARRMLADLDAGALRTEATEAHQTAGNAPPARPGTVGRDTGPVAGETQQEPNQ